MVLNIFLTFIIHLVKFFSSSYILAYFSKCVEFFSHIIQRSHKSSPWPVDMMFFAPVGKQKDTLAAWLRERHLRGGKLE